MKTIGAIAAILVIIVLSAGISTAWEFSINGEAEWRYRYISRTGPNDLFGNADVAQGAPGVGTSIGLAGPNNLQVLLEGYSSKGSDAAYGEQRLWLYPRVRINRALKLRGIVTFQGNLNGSYQANQSPTWPNAPRPNWPTNPHYSGWVMMDSRDIFAGTGLTTPILRAFWLTARLPWGVVAIGRRPAGFGMGWVLHESEVYARSVSFIVPAGPLTFVFSQYLHDSGEDTDPNDDRNQNLTPYTIASAVDQNEVRNWNQAVAVRYAEGGLDIGAMLRVIQLENIHSGQMPVDPGFGTTRTYRDDRSTSFGAFFFGDRVAGGDLPLNGDVTFLLGTTYLKYFNGRFFFNGEYDFQWIEVRRNGGRPISGFPQAWALETGALFGPCKLSLAHFYRSGHDRRAGLFHIGRATGTNPDGTITHDRFNHFITAWGGGEHPMEPYNFLMGLYGTGNNSYAYTVGACTFNDFAAFAGRVDYAAAANLNLFASVVQAYRASNTATPQGWYWGLDGYYKSGISPGPEWFVIPNVPNTDLGWEADVGLSWKLLEGLTFDFLFAFWQPGKWFNWAYRDMTLSNPPQPPLPDPPPIVGTVNPSRRIDPLIGIQTSLRAEF